MTPILPGSSQQEKTAYLTAIASIATADTEASGTEMDYLVELSNAAGLSEEEQQTILNAAAGTSERELIESLDILKSSELRFSLVTDLFAFAKTDGNYDESEQQGVAKIATYLGIDEKQYGLLGEVADKTATANTETGAQPDFLSGSGLGDKLKASGIDGGTLLKGLLTIAAPLILSRMMRKGGSGGALGGGGGLGSVIGMLNGGRGMGGLGNILGRMFG